MKKTPQQKLIMFTTSVDPELHSELQRFAAASGLPIAEVARAAIVAGWTNAKKRLGRQVLERNKELTAVMRSRA